MKTGGQCKDVKSGKLVDRYIYVNNVPLGNVPFISQGVNANFSEFRGIIPGIMSNMNAVNPVALMGAFMQGKEPDCIDLTMEVIDNNNNSSQQTHFVTKSDIANLDPCAFPDRRNPETGNNCRMTFTDMNGNELSTLDNIYVLSISGLLMYIMYKYWTKI